MDPDLERHIDKYYGKYLAKVVNNEDKDKQGKVEVQIPSILEEGRSVWARPCLPPGYFFIPPAGSKIWVEFEGGYIEYPIWVGVYYIPEDVPENAQILPPETFVINTPKGFKIEFYDKKGEEKILITKKDKQEQMITLNYKNGEESIVIEDKNTNKVTMNADGMEIKDKQENKITMNSDGMEIRDKQENKMTMDSDGINIVDKSSNEIILKNAKITIKSSNIVSLNDGNAGIVTGTPNGTHPFCFITGAPIRASMTCKANQ